MTNHTANSRPTHHVYVVEGDGDNAFWTRIGAAWRHKDGEGFNVTLTALPLDGRIVIRAPKATDARPAKRNGR